MKIERKCVYCNSSTDLTKDHVPPKCFFPDPKPSNLITVDCCRQCNKSFEKDDEYMITIISMRYDVAEHKTGKKHQDKLQRMFKKPSKLPFLKSIANKSHLEDFYTTSGLYLGIGMAYQPDVIRIQRFMKRMTYGIYNYETGKILPLENKFFILDEYNITKQPKMEVKLIFNSIYVELKNKPKKIIGDNVFSYSYKMIEDSEFNFICFISFFDYVEYLCISYPRSVQ